MIFKADNGMGELEIITSGDEPDGRVTIEGDIFTRAIVSTLVNNEIEYDTYGRTISLANLTNLGLSQVLRRNGYDVVSTEPELVVPEEKRGVIT